MNIPSGKILIKTLSIDLIDSYLASFSPSVMAALGVATHQAERLYLMQQLAQLETGTTFFVCIMIDTTVVGAIAIRDQAVYERQGQLYCWINERYWSTGLFAQAFAQTTAAYTRQFQAAYITACVDRDNIRSYKALKKLGFADLGFSEGARGKQYQLLLRLHK